MDRLGALAWPQVPERPLLIVPVGSTEQHGPHLPTSTDTVIAVAVAERLAERRPSPVLVAPPLEYGASGEHAAFPGTLSIGLEALELVLIELVRSADWAARVVLVNGHGGNVVAVRSAIARLRQEGREVAWVACGVPGGDLHAGVVETSVLLHLDPSLVLQDRAAAGDARTIEELLPALRRSGVRAVSPNGVLGDPTGATAAAGERYLAAMVDAAADALSRS